jgi:hypothetical protein
MLGLPLQPVGRHSPAREAGGPLRHDGRQGPLVVWPIKGTTHPAWNIIVVMHQVFCGHVSSIQILWSSYSVGSKIPMKIKYLPAFLSTGYSWHGGPNEHASTMGQIGRHGLNKGMACRAWAEPSTRGLARHSPIYYSGHVGPSSQARA